MTTITAAVAAIAAALGPGGGGNPFPDAPARQHFPEFGKCPVAPSNRYLPAGAGCVSKRLVDVDGDGRPDLVLLYHQGKRFHLQVVRASGGQVTAPVLGDRNATVEIARDVNGRPGVELFVWNNHVTTEEDMLVFSFDGHRLRQSSILSFGGHDVGIRYGFACRSGSRVVESMWVERFPIRPRGGIWDRSDTTYRWKGARLAKTGSHRALRVRPPTRAETGARC